MDFEKKLFNVIHAIFTVLYFRAKPTTLLRTNSWISPLKKRTALTCCSTNSARPVISEGLIQDNRRKLRLALTFILFTQKRL